MGIVLRFNVLMEIITVTEGQAQDLGSPVMKLRNKTLLVKIIV